MHDYLTYDGVKDEKNDDSIGSAGSLAHRSERSNGKMSEMWEEDDELSGEEEIIDEKELIKEKTI